MAQFKPFYDPNASAMTEHARSYLISQMLLGAGAGLLQAAQPSQNPVSTGAAITQGLLGAAGGMQQGQAAIQAGEQAKLARMKLGMDMQKSAFEMQKDVEQINARRALSGLPPITAPTMTLGQSMVAGQPASPVPGIAQVQPSVPADDASSMVPGVRMEVLKGEAPPSPQEAMKLSAVYLAAGDAAMANQMREYAYGGVGGFRFGSDWNSQVPIIGGKEDPNTKLVQSQAEKGLVRGADGGFAYAPGIVQSEARKAGATSGASAAATAAVDLRMRPQIEAAVTTARETAQRPFTADPKMFEQEKGLRSEFDALPETKNMKEVQTVYNSAVKSSLLYNNKGADLDLVYAFAKIMDPTSVVREGEQLMINNSAGWKERVEGMWNAVRGGSALTPETKKQLLDVMSNRYGEHAALYTGAAKSYDAISKRYNLDPSRIVNRIELAQPRQYEQIIAEGVRSGAVKPSAIPGATKKVENGETRYYVPGLNGYFREK